MRTTNSRLVELLGDVEAIVWEATPDARFTYVNSAAVFMLGYPVARWLEPNFFADVLLYPEDRNEAVRVRREATERGEDHELEYRAITSSGKVVWLHDVIRVVKDQAGKPILLRGVMMDITKRKLSEDAVHASESRLAAIMAASPAGIFRLDTEGRVTFANQEAARITGIVSDSIDLRRWLEAVHPDDRAAVAGAWKRVQGENAPDHREYRFKKPDGEIVWVLDRGQPERDTAGRVVGFIGTLTDITQLKRNEETIRAHSKILMSMTEGVNTTDEAGNILYANSAFESMFGYAPGELIGKNISTLNHLSPDEFDRRLRAMVAALRERGSWVGEFRNRRKDGTEFWTRARISRSDGADGTIGVCVQEDITEAKRAQEALRESEEKFRRIAESALVGVSLFDGDLFAFSNDTMTQITGYTPGELAGRGREDLTKMFFGEGSHASIYAELLRLDSDEDSAKPVVFEDVNIRHKDGGDRWARLMVTRLVPNQSYPRLFVCVETTDRKRAELALKESEEKFRCVAESAPVGIALFDGKRYTYANETMQCLVGHRLDEFNSWSPAERLERTYAKEDHARLAAVLVTIDSDPKNFKSLQLNDIRVKQKDGSFRWVNALWSPLAPGRGYPMMVMAVDVTERKHTELALRESEEKFRGVAESAYVGIALYDGTRYTYMNQAFSKIVGYRLRDLEGKTQDEIMQLVFDDVDHPRMLAARSALDNAITQHEPVDLEDVRIRHQDGSFRWVSLKFSRLSPDQSMPRMTVCVGMTQRKLAEMALKESEEKFRGVAESAYVGIALYDGTRYTYMNQAFSQIVGYRLRDIEGKTRDEIMQLLFDDVDHPRVFAARSALDNAITQHEPAGLDDVRIRHQDGSFRWVSLRFSRLSPDQSMPRMTVCIDITARKQMEDALRRSEAQLKLIFNSTSDMQVLFRVESPDRFIVEAANKTYVETMRSLFPHMPTSILGCERGELLAALGLTAEQFAAELPKYREAIERRTSISYEIPFVTKGQSMILDVTIEPVVDETGRCTHLLWDGRDISERRRIEARIQQTQRLESLGVLTSGIAHDFNNLLAGILGNADLAREDAPAAGPLRESIDQIEVAARRAADLVRQMLAYSGRGNFVVRRVRLSDMVRELAKLLEVTLSKKATLHFDLDDTAPPIAADATQIQQVIMNLITNASDAIGDQPGTITLRSGAVEYAEEALRAYAPHEPPRPGLFVFLEVTDTGCGMDAATLDRMFDPFFSTKFTGRGLGLAAVLGIVRGHHGGLLVSSRVGHGTTFRVIFPAVGPESPAADTPAPEATHVPSRAATLLIVDDEPRMRDFLVRALQRSGHEVLVAADGRQALEVYDRHKGRIDAVLLDITMPEMGGGDVLRALHQRSPGLPVMLMSGFTEAETRGQFGHSSYAGFLQKPFSLDTLRAAIDALLVGK